MAGSGEREKEGLPQARRGAIADLVDEALYGLTAHGVLDVDAFVERAPPGREEELRELLELLITIRSVTWNL
ncbi:MAG: hypothetical protein AAGG01_15870 [Planctomycetota bacterium]